ncbi:MAG: VgrG-related protein [Actinomycetota bacterium]
MTDRFGTAPRVKLDGQWIEGEVGTQLIQTTVLTDLNAPGMCEVVLADATRTLLSDLGAEFGQDIEIHASAVEDRAEHPIFVGTVYGLEFQADETGCFSLIRGYDPTYALRQRRAVTSYNDVTDSDLVNSLCGEAGVTVDAVEGGDNVHPYVAQLNETHWDFLVRRADAVGSRLHATGGKISFEPIADAADAPDPGDHQSSDPLQLAPGLNVLYLRARQSAAQLTEEVEVRGWDPVEKKEVTARHEVSTSAASADAEPRQVASAQGDAIRIAGRPALSDPDQCQSLATAYAGRLGGAFAFVEGKAYGDPNLVAGTAVSIGQSGRFDGRYTLSSARHVFDQDGYFTYFVISGEHDRSLFGVLGTPSTDAPPGVFPAVVTNINDPDKLGRVKLRLPWLSADFESNWARVMQLGAGPERGLLLLPEVDDEVLVSFLGGDVSHPVVIGGLFNGVDKPPGDGFDDVSDGTVDTRGLQSRVGHSIMLSDTSGEERVVIATSDQSVVITLDQADGGAVTIDAQGDVTVNAAGKVTVDAKGDLTGKAGGNIALEASGNATFRAGGNLKLEASGTVEVKGAVINLN